MSEFRPTKIISKSGNIGDHRLVLNDMGEHDVLELLPQKREDKVKHYNNQGQELTFRIDGQTCRAWYRLKK